MTIYEIDLGAPIRYFIAGEFTSRPGWVHAQYDHGPDFELIIGISGHFDLVYHLADDPSHERSLRVSPSSCVLLPPNITVWGTGRTGENVDFGAVFLASDALQRVRLDGDGGRRLLGRHGRFAWFPVRQEM
ncbi:hypothetical protein JS533_009725, partial [Bifidobacterium amazonense]